MRRQAPQPRAGRRFWRTRRWDALARPMIWWARRSGWSARRRPLSRASSCRWMAASRRIVVCEAAPTPPSGVQPVARGKANAMVIDVQAQGDELTPREVAETLARAFANLALDSKRALIIIPDGTSTAPIP